MRDEVEIRERMTWYNEHSSEDFVGFRRGALEEVLLLDDDHSVEDLVKDYLPFAVDKALGHRGLSAGRSVEKMSEWLWVLGDEELLSRFSQADYPQYGVPQLEVVRQRYPQAVQDLSGQELAMWKRMVQGAPCVDNCTEGCAT